MSLSNTPIACIGSCAHVSLWEVRSPGESQSWALGRWGGSILGNDAVIVATILAGLGMRPTCYLLNPTNADVRHVGESVGPQNVVAIGEESGDLTRSLCLEDQNGHRTWVLSRVPKSPAGLGLIRERVLYADYYPELIEFMNGHLTRLSNESEHMVLNLSALPDLNQAIVLTFVPTVLQVSVGTDLSVDDVMAYARRLATSTRAQKVFITIGPKGAVVATANGCWHEAPRMPLPQSPLGAGAVFSSQVIRGLLGGLDGEVLLRQSVELTAEYLKGQVTKNASDSP